ncbi:cytochrome P450 2B12-like [Symsagittifera roscoffensis]|uniref:cytochrome P450 2B12-like n=1 Tax=Symsagittifera roscoffensis TaxID=84072 RepID=UPI00307C714E
MAATQLGSLVTNETTNSVWESLQDLINNSSPSKKRLIGTALASTVVCAYLLKRYRKNKNDFEELPHAHWLKGHMEHISKYDSIGKALQSLYKESGRPAIAYFRTYLRRNLILFNIREMKELFQTQGSKSSLRPNTLPLYLESVNKGLLQSSGPVWKMNRQVFHSYMRSWGREKQLELIINETKHFISALVEAKSLEPTELLQKAVGNIIATFILGSRFDYADPEFQAIVDSVTKFNARNTFLPTFMFKLLSPFFPSLKNRAKGITDMRNYLKRKIEARIKIGVKQPPETLIDAYALESSATGNQIDFENLEIVIYDLFFAGLETTSTTLAWFLTAVVQNAEIQDKMFDEISREIGDDKIEPDDFKKLPYTVAVQLEVQRYGAIAQNTILHKMETALKLSSGKTISKNQFVTASLYTIMRDPSYFKSPEQFDPDNFLDENGKVRSNMETFVPYGIGPRVCLGQSLADLELKVFIIELIRKFHISSDENIDLTKRIQKITNSPSPYTFNFSER